MAVATSDPEIIGEAPPPAPARPRVLLTGTALVTAAVVMMFAGLIGIYLATRHGVVNPPTGEGARWLPTGTGLVDNQPVDATIPLTPVNMGLFTMLLSAITMQWAVYAVGNNDRQNAYLALGITILFGVALVTATTFLYSQMHLPVATTPGVLIYVISGAHLAMVGGALAFAAVMTFRTLGGEYTARDHEGLTAAALFWYATVAVYCLIWYAIYITK